MFYHYRQNNSGGDFVVNEHVTYNVIIEADNPAQANALAEAHGLYFDGIGDCPCCGHRWYSKWNHADGDEIPKVYDEPVAMAENHWANDNEPNVYVYYLDGRKEVY